MARMMQIALKNCPGCAKSIVASAGICPYCGYDFTQAVVTPTQVQSASPFQSQPAIVPTMTPVVLMQAGNYNSVMDEPGALKRYFRIGSGIVGWTTLLAFSGIISWFVFYTFAQPAASGIHDKEDIGKAISALTVLLVFVGAAVVQFCLMALSVGCILRLIRDALRD